MIISKIIDQADNPIAFKAPKGFMYEVWDIHIVVDIAGDNSFGVVNYLVEPERASLDFDAEYLAIMSTDIAGNAQDFAFTKGERTKYLTIARTGSSAARAFIIIHFELVKVSKTEALIEWFRKGR